MKHLTPSQQNALPSAMDWWASAERNLVISGMPGTGKTYFVKYLVEVLKGAVPLYTAPTNEAVRQLELSLGNKYKAKTTYSALGLSLATRSFKQTIYQRKLPEDFDDYNLLVVDEASMVGQATAEAQKELLDYVLMSGMRCIWLGDWAQLPPVNSVDGVSPVFGLGFKTEELVEVKRHSGHILNWASEIRETLKKPLRNLPKKTDGLQIVPARNSMDFGLDSFSQVIEDKARILVWTNSSTKYCPRPGVAQYNQYIRGRLFGEKEAKESPVYPTDKVLFASPLFVCDAPQELSVDNLLEAEFEIKASVNTRAEVVKTELTVFLGFEVWRTEFELESGNNVIGFIPTVAGQKRKEKLEAMLIGQANAETNHKLRGDLWHYYHTYKQAFADIKHTYCITGHRAQGSTVPNVFVDASNILQNRDRLIAFKNLYVCATRAQENLTLFI